MLFRSPELNGKLIGSAQRVPTPTGSTTILTAVVKKAGAAKQVAFSPSATAWLCAVSEIATERTAGGSGRTPYGVCPLSSAPRPRWAAQFFCASAKPTRSVAIAFILWYDKLAS